MADDLIPPPSPAGRPVREVPPHDEPFSSPSPVTPVDEPPPAAPLTVGASRYRSRFGFVFGALLGLGLLAVALTALVAGGGSRGSSVPAGWSDWRPTSDDHVAAAKEIALHVGRKYRLANGNQLVAVYAGPLEIASLPLSVAIRSAPVGGNIELVEGDAMLYTLNGLGPRGSIPAGKPSPDRHLLLRREALELSLYTFRFIDGVDHVITLLPPPPQDAAAATTAGAGKPPTQALFFRPGDLERQVEAPLRFTIPPATPRPERIPSREKQLIDSLTRGNLFLSSFQQAQDGRAYLVLDRLPR
jgi:hypothetical protein